MHTTVGAPCCYKPSQPTHCWEEVCRRWLQLVLEETSRDPLSVDLPPNSGEGNSQDGLVVRKAEAAEPGASARRRLGPEGPLRWPARRESASRGSEIACYGVNI